MAKLDDAERSNASFDTTRWSVVLSAREIHSQSSRDALETLCRTYWYPLYVYVRRLGHSREDAEDSIQGYFARWLQNDTLVSVAREKGKFRSFLLVSLKHYLANKQEHAQAQKRGGGVVHVSIDLLPAEARYLAEHAIGSAEELYERRWALTLLETAIDRLREEFSRAGKSACFEQLIGCLGAETTFPGYREIAQHLAMDEGAARVAVHRLRRRFREVLREEIAHTVASPTEVDEEMRFLRAALGV